MQTVGVIFKTERDSFRVLDQNGQVRLVQSHQISMRRDSHRAIAADSEGHELRINDNVKEIDGEIQTPSHTAPALCLTLYLHIVGSRRPCSHLSTLLRLQTRLERCLRHSHLSLAAVAPEKILKTSLKAKSALKPGGMAPLSKIGGGP